MLFDLRVVHGDTGEQIIGLCSDASGAASFAGKTVQIHLVRIATTVGAKLTGSIPFAKAVSVSGAEISVAFTDSDFATLLPGYYHCEVKATDGAGSIITYPSGPTPDLLLIDDSVDGA